jgi:flavin reductase (DIM6/NTAB) family NADH-FMN oxidoreductase RutF
MSFSKENTGAVGKIHSGLYIVTAQVGAQGSHMEPDSQASVLVGSQSGLHVGRRDGYLASWVQQVSFEPLLLSVAIKPGRPAYDLITAGEVFTINVVGKNNNGVMKQFWKGYNPDADVFAELSTQLGEQGGLILSDCMAAMECKMVHHLQPGDHDLVIAQVLSSVMLKEDDVPLAHVRKSGLDY